MLYPRALLSSLINAKWDSLFHSFPALALVCSVLRRYHAVRPTLTIAVQMNMSTSCNSNLKATQGNRLRNWRLDYGVRKQCKADVSKVISSQVLQSVL